MTGKPDRSARRYCTHGAMQLTKFGTDTDADGVITCRGCGLPTWGSVHAADLRAEANAPRPVARPTQPVDYAKKNADNLRAIRWSLAGIGVLVGIFFFVQFTSEPEVCVLYANGTRVCD